MRQRLRTGLLAIVALAGAWPVQAQQDPNAAAAAKTAQTPKPPAISPTTVLATVNGKPITAGEYLDYVSQNPLPPGSEREYYEQVVDLLANNVLLRDFLTRQRLQVSEKELDDSVAARARGFKAQSGRDLATYLAENGKDIAWLRSQIAPVLVWEKYIAAVTQDPNVLQKYVNDNKDAFTQVQVRASHILLQLPPDATTAAKDAAKAKLQSIKGDIESGKISFADAANKYSEDDGNKQSPRGGDINGYFFRKGQITESIAARAFSMPVNQISEPFESEFGYHLLLVTDRKPGVPFDMEQQRAAVLNAFRADLMERILLSERKTMKLELKPIPAGLSAPVAAPTTAAPGSQPVAGAPAAKGGAAPR